MSAFYEWPKEGKPPKQPYAFELSNGNLFAFAGVWDAWKDGQRHWLQSFVIVTTEANEMMARIHPHMPVILYPSDYDRGLDREETHRLLRERFRHSGDELQERQTGVDVTCTLARLLDQGGNVVAGDIEQTPEPLSFFGRVQ